MSQSKNQSNPNAKFGTSKREDSNKTYISQKHQKSMPSSYSQESYYGDLEKATSMGRQSSSSKRTSANVGFGKANRFNKNNKNSTSNVDYGKVKENKNKFSSNYFTIMIISFCIHTSFDTIN